MEKILISDIDKELKPYFVKLKRSGKAKKNISFDSFKNEYYNGLLRKGYSLNLEQGYFYR